MGAILFVLMTVLTFAGDKPYQIEKRMVLQQGLSQSRILSVLEDERGFMWFGSADGLNRYDGYTTKIFRNRVGDSTSIPNNIVNSMVEDTEGNIWIGTNNGMAMFNPYTETFISLAETDSALILLGANLISSCVIDQQQNIWCGTNGYGVIKINPMTHRKEYFFYDVADSLYLNNVFNLFVDSKNQLWMAGFLNKAIPVYSIENDTITFRGIDGIEREKKNGYRMTSIYEDVNNRMWIGLVDYSGRLGSLYFLENQQKVFLNYKNLINKEFGDVFADNFNAVVSIVGNPKKDQIIFGSLLGGVFTFRFDETPKAFYTHSPFDDPRIICLYFGSNGILWIGTNGYGVELSVPDHTVFQHVSSKTNPAFTVESIRAFAEDKHHYWVGGYYGLSKISKDFEDFETVYNPSVYTIANNQLNQNQLWLGSEGGGLFPFSKTEFTEIATPYKYTNAQSPSIKYVQKIFPVSDTLVLIGTRDGLFGLNPENNIMTPYNFQSLAISPSYKEVRSISSVGQDEILIGYADGEIGQFDLRNNKISTFGLLSKIQKYIHYNPVNCIYLDSQNSYWVATTNGLIQVNSITGQVRLFTEDDGLPNSHVYGILPDVEGNLWMSTNNGISCYDPQEDNFRNYDVSDGLQNNEFNTGAFFKAENGNLFFGGINGFNYFNPEDIKQNSLVPKIEITGIKIGNTMLKRPKEQWAQHRLVIQPRQEVFTIEFAGLSYISSNKNLYKYRIQEVSNDWVDLGNQHQITFINMSPGKYTLEILASNNHGLWVDKPLIFAIEILPAFFESPLFIWLLIIFLLLIVLVGIRMRVRQLKHQKMRLQVYVEEQTTNLIKVNEILRGEILKHENTTKKLSASNETKDRFLSIIGHDLIGPLGVIQGFSELLYKRADDFSEQEKISFAQTINLTGKELSSLLINLLQWSKLKSDTIPVNPTMVELKSIVNNSVLLLQGNIDEKRLHLQVDIMEETKVFADKNLLSTILRNLLSNAIKFTPKHGQITIKSIPMGAMQQISVVDTGVGISKENQAKIFNADVNFTTKGTNNESGTGLGLNLVYEFVLLSKGEIKVDSQPGRGTSFMFTLPAFKPAN